MFQYRFVRLSAWLTRSQFRGCRCHVPHSRPTTRQDKKTAADAAVAFPSAVTTREDEAGKIQQFIDEVLDLDLAPSILLENVSHLNAKNGYYARSKLQRHYNGETYQL